MVFTMIAAKVCNAVSHTTSTMRCYISGATFKEFKDLIKMRDSKQNCLKFGLLIQNARIRLFESLLHISYELPIKNGK